MRNNAISAVRMGYCSSTTTNPADFREVPDENFMRLLKAIEDSPSPVEELGDKAKIESLERELIAAHAENIDLRLRLNNVELLYGLELKKSGKSHLKPENGNGASGIDAV